MVNGSSHRDKGNDFLGLVIRQRGKAKVQRLRDENVPKLVMVVRIYTVSYGFLNYICYFIGEVFSYFFLLVKNKFLGGLLMQIKELGHAL